MTYEAICIYRDESPVCCRQFDPTTGQGDHVLPSVLGEFKGDRRFRGVCGPCNNLFGQYEQQIVQSGPEGFYRRHANARSKRISRGGIKPMRGAKGAPAPEHIVNIGDEMIRVRLSKDNPEDVYPYDQVRVTDDSDREFTIELHPAMTSEQLRGRMDKLGIKSVKKAFVHCAEEHWESFTAIVKEVCGNAPLDEFEPMEVGSHRVHGQANFTVNTAYFQAIAKIAFHYYLVHGKRGFRGDEPLFEAIRSFICKGGDVNRFFLPDDRLRMPFGPEYGASPANWCHLLFADESGPEVVSRVQLFLGPWCVPNPHSVLLCRLDERSANPMLVGHIYQFDDSNESSRYSGSVQELPPDAFIAL